MPIGSLLFGKKQKRAAQQIADAQKQGERLRQAMANAEAHRERIRQQREARIKRAQVIQGASNAGIGLGSSPVLGATTSIGSQLGQGLGTLGQTSSFAGMISQQNQFAADAQARLQRAQANASLWDSVGSSVLQLGATAAGAFGGVAGAATTAAGGNTFQGIASQTGYGGLGSGRT